MTARRKSISTLVFSLAMAAAAGSARAVAETAVRIQADPGGRAFVPLAAPGPADLNGLIDFAAPDISSLHLPRADMPFSRADPAADLAPVEGDHYRALILPLHPDPYERYLLRGTMNGRSDDVLARLKGMETIRLDFTEAPGFGHQTATLSVLRRLRQLGYEGEIEAIFDSSRSLADKLAVLLPGFDPQRMHEQQHIPGLDVTVESAAHFAGRAKKPVELAMTGGQESADLGTPAFLNAELYLDLSPLGWRPNDSVWIRGRTEPKTIRPTSPLAFIYPPAALDDLDDGYFADLSRTAIAPRKIEGIKSLVRDIRDHELLPVYGLHFLDAAAVHRLLLAVSSVLDRGGGLMSRRGVVLALLLEAPGKIAQALELAARSLPVNRSLRDRLLTASIADPGLPRTLRNLKAGQILLLQTGPVPPSVFEALFNESTLPPTLEGKNAINLAALLGIPFIPIKSQALNDLFRFLPEPWLSERKRDALLGGDYSSALRPFPAVADALAKGPNGIRDSETIADFIIEMLEPGSRLREMFHKARIRQDDFNGDKLIHGLRAAFSP